MRNELCHQDEIRLRLRVSKPVIGLHVLTLDNPHNIENSKMAAAIWTITALYMTFCGH